MQCQKLRTYMETGRVVFLPQRAITPNPSQPRKLFDREALEELAESIRSHGILQPLSVRRVGAGYELIAGERRLRAAALAGLTEIPCIIMNMDEQESGLAALVENLQRQDLDFIEEAEGISLLMSRFQKSQEQIAKLLGKSQSGVANKLRLLKHEREVLQAIRDHGLTERHARALLKLRSPEEKLRVISRITEGQWTVERTEHYIQQLLCPEEPAQKNADVGLFLNRMGQQLQKFQSLGIPVVTERKETESQIIFSITLPKT